MALLALGKFPPGAGVHENMMAKTPWILVKVGSKSPFEHRLICSWKENFHVILAVVPGLDAVKYGGQLDLVHSRSGLLAYRYEHSTRFRLDLAAELVTKLVAAIPAELDFNIEVEGFAYNAANLTKFARDLGLVTAEFRKANGVTK